MIYLSNMPISHFAIFMDSAIHIHSPKISHRPRHNPDVLHQGVV